MVDLLLDLIVDLFLSRLFAGLLITGLLCWFIVNSVEGDELKLMIAIPVGLIGVFLSFRWQLLGKRT